MRYRALALAGWPRFPFQVSDNRSPQTAGPSTASSPTTALAKARFRFQSARRWSRCTTARTDRRLGPSRNWLASTAPCGWYGVGCADSKVWGCAQRQPPSGTYRPHSAISATCGFEFPHNMLTGPFPSSWPVVQSVAPGPHREPAGRPFRRAGEPQQPLLLSLNWNQLTGAIPPELGDLVTWRHFFLSNNRLSGPILPNSGTHSLRE